jgi:hypothetical protein
VQPLWKPVLRLIQKLKIDLLYDPAISLLGIYPEFKSSYKRGTCTPMFFSALFTIAKLWKQSRGQQLMNSKENVEYILHGLLSRHKEK